MRYVIITTGRGFFSVVFLASLIVIIELEVSKRSIRQMRQDYLKYFEFDPSVFSVVGIKVLGGDSELTTPLSEHIQCYEFLNIFNAMIHRIYAVPASPRGAVDASAGWGRDRGGGAVGLRNAEGISLC